MKRIGNLFKKDLLLGIKDVFILLELAFSLVIMLLLVFIIPEDIATTGLVYIYDSTGIVENFVKTYAADEASQMGEFYVHSRDEVIAGMVKDKNAVGLLISENAAGTYDVQLYTQPYTIEMIPKYINVDIEDLLSMLKPPAGVYPPDVYNSIRITSLQWGLRDELPFNQRLLPPVLLMMVGMIGLFAMISLVSQERSEGTIRAYKVTPARLWEFLLSKHLVLLVTSLATFSILYIPLMGLSGYPEALLIIMLTVLMGSSIGVILGAIYDNPMAGILWVLLLLIVLSLPAISLFSPIFSPDWLKIIPSYHTLFGLDAVMFPDNNRHIFWESAGILAVINVIFVPLSGLIFSRCVRKEV